MPSRKKIHSICGAKQSLFHRAARMWGGIYRRRVSHPNIINIQRASTIVLALLSAFCCVHFLVDHLDHLPMIQLIQPSVDSWIIYQSPRQVLPNCITPKLWHLLLHLPLATREKTEIKWEPNFHKEASLPRLGSKIRRGKKIFFLTPLTNKKIHFTFSVEH